LYGCDSSSQTPWPLHCSGSDFASHEQVRREG
jgi:hypothetical protein